MDSGVPDEILSYKAKLEETAKALDVGISRRVAELGLNCYDYLEPHILVNFASGVAKLLEHARAQYARSPDSFKISGALDNALSDLAIGASELLNRR